MRPLAFVFLRLLLAWAIVSGAAARAQPDAPPVSHTLLSRYGFVDEDAGYLLFDLTSGHALEAHRPNEPRIPASTSKIATAVAALRILGVDYRFSTSLLTTGEIRNGVLSGNVYLRGGGDPTFSTDDLQKLALALRRAGVKRAAGNFFYDESLLPTTREIESRQPIAVSYNPGLSALSVNYNRIRLRWKHKPGAATFTTTVLSPADGGPVVVKDITTGALPAHLGRQIKFLPDDGATDRWLLSRSLPARGQEELPVRNNPGRLTALLFRTLCRQGGVALPLPQPGAAPGAARLLHAHDSEPLSKIIAKTLYYSNNLTAELVGQAAVRQLHSAPLSLHESATLLASWYRRILSHGDWRGFHAVNHSGLSSAARHTPRQLADILRYAWNTQLGGARFPELLSSPQWGKDENYVRGMVKAKSGTMSYADGLAGYLTTARGQQLGFVILMTDFARRAVLDASLDVRIADPPPEARSWTNRAKAFEQALVTRWVTQY